jgi:hypothetical protein
MIRMTANRRIERTCETISVISTMTTFCCACLVPVRIVFPSLGLKGSFPNQCKEEQLQQVRVLVRHGKVTQLSFRQCHLTELANKADAVIVNMGKTFLVFAVRCERSMLSDTEPEN